MSTAKTFTTPVGRLVRGSLYKPQTTDAEGKPLVVKSGPNAGQPRIDYYFAVAIPKGPEQHWSQTPWGALIHSVGAAAFPAGQSGAPTFAWKIIDGDSSVPNRQGKKPVDQAGYRGCWVLNFSGGYAPRIFNANGTAPITEVDAVKPGYYIQVAASVDGNGSMQQPGIYLNHSMVALAGYGEEIVFGPDPTAAGFGQSPLPPGASAVPVAAMAAPVAAAPQPAYTPPAAPAPAAPLPPVPPNPAILQVPVPAPLPAKVMLPLATGMGYTYEALKSAGWSDVQMVQAGYLAP